jgi:signal transduction histidine kinase
MIALLIGMLSLLQPQIEFPDTNTSIVVLHDSLTVQDGEVLSLTNLEGWEFTTDNLEDSMASVRWMRLEQPVSNQDAFPDSLWNGFGYFRLKFKVDSTFSQKEAFLRFSSFRNVSTEIYLNDKSILKIGNPSREKESEEIVARYTGMGQPVNLKPDTEYTLVVKKSYLRYSQYIAFTNLGRTSKPHSFSLSLASTDYVQTAIEREKVNILIAGTSVSIIFILSILYLILYFKVKDQKENLWLVLLMVSIGGIALNWFLTQFTLHSFWFSLVLDFIILNFLSALSFLLVPLVTHKLLKVQAHIFWKVYVIVGIVLYFLRIDILGEITFTLILFISLTGGLIAIYKAYKQGVRDTVIPALSILGVPLVVIVGLAIDYFGFRGVYFIPTLTFLVYNILPVGLSIYQGKKFLRLNTEMENLVTQRTTQLETANSKLEESFSELKATQSQLVQQEKLASLGQLTAGIAHEIKNPLNFVNNFSDLSLELVEEIREEVIRQKAEGKSETPKVKGEKSPFEGGSERREQGDDTEADSGSANIPLNPSSHRDPFGARGEDESNPQFNLILEILDDIETNLKTIHKHGSRADSIVKSMLQHSRGGDGKMEPTHINPLIKEYVNLAFHGMKAGENPINVDIDLQLDENVGEVPLVAEDFSRVILNLVNNAFDAMKEKTLQGFQTLGGLEDYQPKLSIRTSRNENTVIIEIEDNGPGIPDEIKDKILQPFFTTKKGTAGTGLGLSITNDIIKAHGGSLDVRSKPDRGTLFTINLTA